MTYRLTEQVNKHNVTTSGESNTRPHHRHSVHRTHLYSEEWKPFEWFDPWDDFTYRNKQVRYRYSHRSFSDISCNFPNSARNTRDFPSSIGKARDFLSSAAFKECTIAPKGAALLLLRSSKNKHQTEYCCLSVNGKKRFYYYHSPLSCKTVRQVQSHYLFRELTH